jgi:hypothetical protein
MRALDWGGTFGKSSLQSSVTEKLDQPGASFIASVSIVEWIFRRDNDGDQLQHSHYDNDH